MTLKHYITIKFIKTSYLKSINTFIEKKYILVQAHLICKQHLSALRHTYHPRGMANTVRMRTTILPGQWQPWTAVSPLLGLISMA